jgi:hypothetical protein
MVMATREAPTPRISISVTHRQAQLLHHAATTTPGVSAISEIVRRAVDLYFEKHGSPLPQ